MVGISENQASLTASNPSRQSFRLAAPISRHANPRIFFIGELMRAVFRARLQHAFESHWFPVEGGP
jgi:hypothetical protein